MMKDNFSGHAAAYARFRPAYPPELIAFLRDLATHPATLWDCGTGNGQLAAALAPYFGRVLATDISENQLKNALQLPNIHYSRQAAESTDFDAQSVDMITVAQAIHWFDFDRFYAEVRRVARPGALLVLAGYGLIRITPALNAVIDEFYTGTVGPFWDPERHYIDEAYETVPFPFEEKEVPPFRMRFRWTIEQLLGYLDTWSAVQHYKRANEADPLLLIREPLRAAWGNAEYLEVEFPVFVRVGAISH
ncbi:MAG: class I SAM-dependent methyltransferase [Flavobacteriales bacterium]